MGVDYELIWGAGNDPLIILKNDSRVVKVNSLAEGQSDGREGWLLTKVNYQVKNIFRRGNLFIQR